MNLTEHFSVEELTVSETAARLRIDNTPTPHILDNLARLAMGLEQIRLVLGHPIHITSGYRCKALNQAVGGSKNSQHMLGLAADIYCPQFGTPLEVCRAIANANLGTDQIIAEGKWCHVSFPEAGKVARNDLLTAHFGTSGTTYELGLNQA